MSLDLKPFEGISEADLQQLVTNGVPENLTIEYKREAYGGRD